MAKKEKAIPFTVTTLLLIALVARLLMASFGTLPLDQNSFIGWSMRLNNSGFASFYETWSDYLPGYLYVLWFLGAVSEYFPFGTTILYKLPAIFADLATGYLIYDIFKKRTRKRMGLIAAAMYVFNPAIIANSTLWGQVDSLTAFFSLASLWLLPERVTLSAISFALGMLIKPQTIFVLPAIGFMLFVRRKAVTDYLIFALTAVSLFVIGFVPFAGEGNLIGFIGERIGATLGQYPYTSVNAINFWSIFGFWKSDTGSLVSPQNIGYAISVFLGLFILVKLIQKRKAKEDLHFSHYYLAAMSFLVGYLFFTRIHERHLLPALAPLLVASAGQASLVIPYIGFSLLYVINLYYAFVWITRDFHAVIDPFGITLLSVLSVVLFLIAAFSDKLRISGLWRPNLKLKGRKDKPFFTAAKSSPNLRYVFMAVLVFALATRLFALNSPQNEYFDEVYHAFTARVMLEGDPKAWEWWNTSPDGFAYEWTHPPLAKLGMVAGMSIFGENAFGWRAPGAFLGTIAVFLVYMIAREIFDDKKVALFSSLIFALDGLPLVMSRIGMNDIYFLTAMLASLYFFLRRNHPLSALFLGLAAASKWTVFWFLPVLALFHFALKRRITYGYIWYAVIPPMTYLASYIPMFTSGHTWSQFIEVQKQMWWYHTNLDATHPFTSPWWSWPLLKRPVWAYTGGVDTGSVSNIYIMGNPLIMWAGLVSVFYLLWFAVTQGSKKIALIAFAYLAFFVPWAASPRIMFYYHYLPSIPFLAIALGLTIRRHPKIVVPFFSLSIIVFFYFFPHLTGLSVPLSWDNSYYWLPTWR